MDAKCPDLGDVLGASGSQEDVALTFEMPAPPETHPAATEPPPLSFTVERAWLEE